MTLIVCVDDHLGMAFGGKRQSRDRAICEDMIAFAAGRPLNMHPRSAKLFEGLAGEIVTCETWMETAGRDVCCFAEFCAVKELAQCAEELVLYRWNRHYPADLRFDVPLEDWRLTQVSEFVGTSHEKITREVYVREDQ